MDMDKPVRFAVTAVVADADELPAVPTIVAPVQVVRADPAL